MALNVDQGDVETTEQGEIRTILGTASNGGEYENSGTVIVTMMEIGLSPVDSITGEIVGNCDVSVPAFNFVGETGSPASEVKIPTIGGEVSIEVDSDMGQRNKRYYRTIKEVDTSEESAEVKMERAENIGNSV